MDMPTFEDLFRQIKINMWMFGIPYNSSVQLRFKLLYVALFIIVIAELAFLFTKFDAENFLELTHSAPCGIYGLWSVLKIVPIVFHRQEIFDLTKSLNGLYNKILANPERCAVVKKEILVVKTLIKYFLILNTILISVYNFSSLIFMLYGYIKTNTVKFGLPYPIILPFSIHSWSTWFFVYLYSILTGFVCVLYFATVDALYCALTSQICINFTIISSGMRSINTNNTNLLKELVMEHQYVLKLSADLEKIFKLPLLFNVLVGSLVICAIGVNITMGDWAHVPGSTLFLLSVLFQILLMSIFGEKLIRESIKVGDAAFLCNWYEMDTKFKKIILFIVTRAQRQQQLTAYKFSVISYQSFTKIVSTSWSYFTILRTVVYNPSETIQTEKA